MDTGILPRRSLAAAGTNCIWMAAQAATGLKTNSTNSASGDLNLGYAPVSAQNYYTGILDQVTLFPQALSADQVLGLYQSWNPITLATTGSGVTTTTWSTQVPTGLEGNYQIDLTGTDVLGNRNDLRSTWNHWRGEIDTAVPRITFNVTYSGAGSSAQTHFTASIVDLNLSEPDVRIPCANPTATRTYNTLTPPGAPQQLNQLDLVCTVNGIVTDGLVAQACDTYLHCAAQLAPDYKMYLSSDSGILRTNPFNFAQLETVIAKPTASPNGGLAVDTTRGKIYWAEATSVKRANLDGSNVETIITGLNNVVDVGVDPGRARCIGRNSSASGVRIWMVPAIRCS